MAGQRPRNSAVRRRSTTALPEGAQELGSNIKDGYVCKDQIPSSQDPGASSLVALAAKKAATGAAKNEVALTSVGEDYFISMGPRDYRIRGLQKNASLLKS